MIALVLATLLIGAVLGMKFKVLILIPAIGLALAAILIGGVARGDSASTIVITAELAAVCLQIGYLGGIIAFYGSGRARAGRLHNAALRAQSAR